MDPQWVQLRWHRRIIDAQGVCPRISRRDGVQRKDVIDAPSRGRVVPSSENLNKLS